MPRINRKGKQNGSRTKTKPGQHYRVYCGSCEPAHPANPENSVHVVVDGTNPPSVITCKNGHKTKVHV
jgi:hypothetical protein